MKMISNINYFITDHLGSTRVVTDNSGNIKEQNDYYPFGMRHSNANLMLSANRWGFNGKEKQTTANINYMDYGARMYDDFTGRWFVIDPLAEKYYPVSSYAFSANNPLRFVDPNGMDWIVANGTYDYQWRDDINAKSTMPEGYQYVGANNADILTNIGINNNLPEKSTNDIGMVAAGAEVGRYAVSHLVNVKEKSNATIGANISYSKDNATENNSSGRTFNGISIGITEVSSNSGVDGNIQSGGLVSVKYGDKTYNSILQTPKGSYVYEAGTAQTIANINIPKSDLSVGAKLSQIQVEGNWFVKKTEGITPVVRHAFVPYPLSFKHTWTFKK